MWTAFFLQSHTTALPPTPNKTSTECELSHWRYRLAQRISDTCTCTLAEQQSAPGKTLMLLFPPQPPEGRHIPEKLFHGTWPQAHNVYSYHAVTVFQTPQGRMGIASDLEKLQFKYAAKWSLILQWSWCMQGDCGLPLPKLWMLKHPAYGFNSWKNQCISMNKTLSLGCVGQLDI